MSDVKRSVTVQISDSDTTSAASSTSELLLEQEEWPVPPDDIVSMGVIADANGWTLWNSFQEEGSPDYDDAQNHWAWTLDAYLAQCGQNADGGYTTLVYVIKAPSGLEYRLVISHGTAEEDVTRDTFLKEESVSIQFEKIPNLNYRIEELVSAEWEGECYDQDGTVVPSPAISLLPDGRVHISEEVYGIARLAFRVFADVYTLTIPRRNEATEERLVSTVTAFYGDGQIAELVLDPPPLADVDCLGYTFEVSPSDPPVEEVRTAFAVYDYCTGEEVTDFVVEVDGEEVDPDGVDLAVGTHALKVTANGYTPTDEDDLDDNDSFTL